MAAITQTKGRWYLRRSRKPNKLLGVDPEPREVENWRAIWAEAREQGQPSKGGRPTKEEKALAVLRANPLLMQRVLDGSALVPLDPEPPVAPDPENPNGWPSITPDDAIRDLLASLPEGSTKDGYASALNIQADALGRESFETWTGWWEWLYATYPNKHTRQNHISAANALIKHSRKNTVRRHIPDFKPVADRPKLTKKAKRKARRLETISIPYTLGEMVGLTNTSLLLNGDWHYSTLAEHVCALAGPHIGDARVMLGGWGNDGPAGQMGCEHCDGRGNMVANGVGGREKVADCPHCQDWGFQWSGPAGLAWWRGYRVKTGERINIPLAPALTKLLRPLAFARGLKYQGRPGRGTAGRLPKSTMQFRTAHDAIEARAGVKKVKGQSWKRFRTGFHRVLQNELRLPKPVRQRLLAHQVGDEAAIGAYAAVLDQELVDAVIEYEKLFLAAEPERTAGSGAA